MSIRRQALHSRNGLRPLLVSLLLCGVPGCSPKQGGTDLVSTRLPMPVAVASTGPARRAILISIDGLRHDAMASAPARTLLAALREGTYCPEAETISRSETLPSHTSMLTGLDAPHHAVTWNDYRPGSLPVSSIFTVARAAGLSTAFLYSKDKLAFLKPAAGVHWSLGPRPGGRQAAAGELAEAFRREWPGNPCQLTFIHLGDPDAAGHASGWMSAAYLEAVFRSDQAVRTILETLRAGGFLETTAIIITSDHGGHDRGHFVPGEPPRPEDTLIPWICIGPEVPREVSLQRTVRTIDTAGTVLRFLGLRFSEPTDGAVIQEVFRSP